MRSCSGLIDRSWVATMYQLGLVFQAGLVTLCVNESVEIGTCDIALKWDTAGGTSAAKSAAKCAWSKRRCGRRPCMACGVPRPIDVQPYPIRLVNWFMSK